MSRICVNMFFFSRHSLTRSSIRKCSSNPHPLVSGLKKSKRSNLIMVRSFILKDRIPKKLFNNTWRISIIKKENIKDIRKSRLHLRSRRLPTPGLVSIS
jgi:hypothetical protein